MKTLSDEEIQEMTRLRNGLVGTYGARDEMLTRYEEIYFMTKEDRPRGLEKLGEDVKLTISSSGRDSVTGMKRILDTAKIHVDIEGRGGNKDKVEKGLKKMLAVSGEYKPASVEKDTNLSAVLYGPATLMVEAVHDLIENQYQTIEGEKMVKNEYVTAQLQMIQKRTPFLLHAVNARSSYPMWGAYGMIGHLRKYTLRGAEIQDRWGVVVRDVNKEYEVQDFFHYEKRLVTADAIKEPLMACEWVSRDEAGKIIGSINIPIFTRYSGGTSLFHEPDKQAQPLLYAKAKGNWDLRENLFWTYLFTALNQQGIPGPIIMVDPENADQDIEVDYRGGLRIIKAKGTMVDPQVIDGDVLQLKNLMDGQSATQTIHPQTLGENTRGVTFSQFALASKAGLIPAQDPKEAQEALYKDAFTHILQRIKLETIENDLISPADIPEDLEIKVRLEPDLEQDDLRNAQTVQALKSAGANVSDEWINTTQLKIADNKAMLRQKTKEELFRSMLAFVQQKPEIMEKFVMGMLGMNPNPPPEQPPPGPEGELPTEGAPPSGGEGFEQPPMTDPMIPPQERM